MKGLAALAAALALSGPVHAAGGSAGAERPDACADLLPAAAMAAGPRPVTARDVAMVRDFGGAEIYADESPLSPSPDGRTVAFVLSRAHPDSNDYCQALVTLALGGGRPRPLDRGGAFLSYTTQDQRGLVTPTGMGRVIKPRWSPDGKWIAYLRRDGARTRVWRAAADGSGAAPIAAAAVDIESFAWTADGERIVIATRPGLIAAEARIAAESRSGYLYDDRFVPLYANRPQVRGPLPLVFTTVTLATGASRNADADERRLIAQAERPDYPAGATRVARASNGRQAWLAAEKQGQYLSPTSLWASGAHGVVHCLARACGDGIVGLWWSSDGHRVYFLRREGPGDSQLGFYVWTPDGAPPHRTFATEDTISGCEPVGARLLCLREASTRPGRMVLLDPETGRVNIVFDPNPEFQSLILGSVKRLHWRNEFGFETFGDLVLPPGHRPGEKLPLIVVQYHSRGFLRGGSGDEYPIHPFAMRGFAVLSVERPPIYTHALAPGNWPSWKDAEPENVREWHERRNVASSVLAGVDAAVALGVIDPARIGLTGLSDGMTTAAYLLINTNRFAATSISTCCADPKTDLILGGPAWEAERERFGYPAPTEDRPAFWQPVSLAMNAARIKAPLLMQLSDDEYLRAVETQSAFRDAGTPVEMYVFSGEHHVKWQPAHRLAIYERNLDWFSFWLQSLTDPDPAKRDQFARWQAMRVKTTSRSGTRIP